MKQFAITIILVISLFNLCSVGKASNNGTSKPQVWYSDAQDKLREVVPSLSVLEDQFPEDPEILLGLATIYARYCPTRELSRRAVQLYRKVIELDPMNKPARIGVVQEVFESFSYKRFWMVESLYSQEYYAKKKNLQEVEILDVPWEDEINDLLCEFLREEGQEKIIVRDFNEALVRVCEKYDRKYLPVILAELDNAERFEPGNALYNYRRAQLYFDIGNAEKGLEELEKGSRKPYFNRYLVQTAAARKRILQKADFPDKYRHTIEKEVSRAWGLPGESFLDPAHNMNPWRVPDKPSAFKISKQEQKSGNLKKAIDIYETAIRIAKQYDEEPIPGEAGQGPRKQSDRKKREYLFEKIARQQLNEIRSHLKTRDSLCHD